MVDPEFEGDHPDEASSPDEACDKVHKDPDPAPSSSDSLHIVSKRESRHRYCLVAFGFLYTFFFSGAFFGWGPMQLMLEDNGSYSSKCTAEEQESGEICPAQSAALVQIHFVAQVTQFISPLLGTILDRYGPPVFSYLMGMLGLTGISLMIAAAESEADWLLYAAFISIAITTWMGGLMTLQTALVFQRRTRARVLFVINSLFDAGSLTYLGLWGLSEAFDWSLATVASLYLGLALFSFGGAAYFWTGVVPEKEELVDKAESLEMPLKENATKFSSSSAIEGGSGKNASQLDTEVDASPTKHTDEPQHSRHETDLVTSDEPRDSIETVDADSSYVLIADRTAMQQVLSTPFLMFLAYALIMITVNQWTLTTTRDFLASLGDDEENNKYLTIFTLLSPASLVAAPFGDSITAKYGFQGGFLVINALAIGYNLVRLLSDDLNVQIIGFILFSFFRCFLFGVTFSVLPVLLSQNIVGKAMGLTFGTSGLTAYVNVPLSNLAIEKKEGDFFIPNLIYTLAVIPCFLLSWGLAKAIDKETRIKEQRKSTQTT